MPLLRGICHSDEYLSDEHIQYFVQYLRVELGYSSCTIQAYASDLQALARYLKNNTGAYQDFNSESILKYLQNLREMHGVSARSCNRKLASFKHMARFVLCNKSAIFQRSGNANICNEDREKIFLKITKMQNFKTALKIKSQIGPESVDLLIATAYQKIQQTNPPPHAIKLYVLLQVLVQTGLRISEALSLRLKNVYLNDIQSNFADTKRASLKVMGKGGKERMVPISVDLYQIIMQYTPGMREYIFSSATNPWSRQGAFLALKKLAQEANIDPACVSPHKMRHFLATRLINNGANILHVKKLLGHEQLATTMLYSSVDPKILLQMVMEYHELMHTE